MRMRKKFMMITLKNYIFLLAFLRTRTEHYSLLEKISENSRAYFHFINGYNKTRRKDTKWSRQN